MIVYTRWLPKGVNGMFLLWIILIRAGHENSRDLLAHELVHREQFRKDWLWPFKYLFSRKHRLAYEVEAYKEQMRVGGMSVDQAADLLSSLYFLNITKDEAKDYFK